MAGATFDDALRRVLAHEGGYSNHPSDPGGPTNFGITLGDYRGYVKASATAADVCAMRLDEAKAIYRDKYWNAMRCDELAAGLDYAVFDYGINSGVGRAVKVLQRLLTLPDDGRMTDAVIAAARKQDAAGLTMRLCDERLAFLKRLKTWPVFGAGWGRRVSEVRAAALALTGQAAPVQPAADKTTVRIGKSFRTTIAGVIAALALSAAHAVVAPFTMETNMSILFLILAIAGGYAASIFTWPRLRQALVGLDNEIDDLRAKARALEARLRG